MREILFRGQTRKYGERVRMGDGQKLPGRWVYGGVLQGIGSHSIIYGGENVNDPSEGLQKWCVHTDTLGQYTGLNDKNGKKIFEGDIVKSEFTQKPYIVCFGEYTYTNEYGEEESACGWYNEEEYGYVTAFGRPDAWATVIGNIHDNPELIEESV